MHQLSHLQGRMVYAPLLLVLCRLLQGLSMAGEEIGAVLFLTENAPVKKQGIAGAIISGSVYSGLFFGSVITLLVVTLVPKDDLYVWGWRIPFLLSFLLGLIALIIRFKQTDTEQFIAIKNSNTIVKNPFLTVLKEQPLLLAHATLLNAALAVAVYLFAVYIPTYMSTNSDFSLQTSMLICSFCFLLISVFIILVGMWVDKVGTRLPLLISCSGFILFSYFIFRLLSSHTVITTLLAEFIMIILLGLNAGAIMPLLVNSFRVNIRFAGSCVAFNMSMTIFGSTAPIIALYLTKLTGSMNSPCLYLMFASGLTIFSVAYLYKRQQSSIVPSNVMSNVQNQGNESVITS